MEARKSNQGWIAFDLDGTLAIYNGWEENEWKIGEPVKPMLDLLKRKLREGYDCRILTARAGLTEARNDGGQAATKEYQEKQVSQVKRWCIRHLNTELEVTASKDFKMIEYYDDRCVQVITNKGIILQDLLTDFFKKVTEAFR